MRARHGTQVLATALLLGALVQGAMAAYMPIKAAVAQGLLEVSWRARVAGEQRVPWPWADTWPVARLTRGGEDDGLIVLAGVSGEALAFGPGWLPASAELGAPGDAVVAGHNDTHFAFLRSLEVGEALEVVLPSGDRTRFQVVERLVADSRRTQLQPARTGPSRLILVTCYPFSSLNAGGPERFIVILNRVNGHEGARELAT